RRNDAGDWCPVLPAIPPPPARDWAAGAAGQGGRAGQRVPQESDHLREPPAAVWQGPGRGTGPSAELHLSLLLRWRGAESRLADGVLLRLHPSDVRGSAATGHVLRSRTPGEWLRRVLRTDGEASGRRRRVLAPRVLHDRVLRHR